MAALDRRTHTLPTRVDRSSRAGRYEYERTLTTVANSYIRPNVSSYIKNLQANFA